jgi:hypothetical protein
VRPGVTGWAQINGGTTLTPQDKAALDEWYVQNASLWLDVKILFWTIGFLIHGEGRPAGGSGYRSQSAPPEGAEVQAELRSAAQPNGEPISFARRQRIANI